MRSRIHSFSLWLVAIALLFPLFFQLSGGIYKSFKVVTDSGGLLAQLPLPISIAACIVGVLVFSRNYRKAFPVLIFIAIFAAAMGISLLLGSTSDDGGKRKLVLAAQFLLPTMGLVLGQMVPDDRRTVARAFMWVLLVIVPLQLMAGWLQETVTLTHYLYVFSIYQHFQFVPVVFVLAFCFVVVHLWDQHRLYLCLLIGLLGVYVTASASFLAIALYGAFLLLFLAGKVLRGGSGRVVGLLILGGGVAATVIAMSLYYGMAKNSTNVKDDDGQYVGKFQTLAQGKMPLNLKNRLDDWAMYGRGIGESTRTLLMGHAEPPARQVKTSAHNWYLDFTYSFGLVPLLPFAALAVMTSRRVWRLRRSLPAETWWLAGLVAFMVLIDNNFKVTLRQPYPGIFAYFLWGLLLSRLQAGPSDSSER